MSLSNMLLIFPLYNAPCNCNSNCPFLARPTLEYHRQWFFSEHFDENSYSSSFRGNEKFCCPIWDFFCSRVLCYVKYKCPLLVCKWVYFLAHFAPKICKGHVWQWFLKSLHLTNGITSSVSEVWLFSAKFNIRALTVTFIFLLKRVIYFWGLNM